MKLYVGPNKKNAKEISFEGILAVVLSKSGFIVDQGEHGDESASWVEVQKYISKERKKDTVAVGEILGKRILINFVFDAEDKNKIDDISIYESEVKVIIDEDNQKKIG